VTASGALNDGEKNFLEFHHRGHHPFRGEEDDELTLKKFKNRIARLPLAARNAIRGLKGLQSHPMTLIRH
jgi:hypothetical protein